MTLCRNGKYVFKSHQVGIMIYIMKVAKCEKLCVGGGGFSLKFPPMLVVSDVLDKSGLADAAWRS